MPLPFILAGAALAATGTGIKKGLDAKRKNEEAREIVEEAQEKFENAKEELDLTSEELNNLLTNFAKFKLKIFETRMAVLIKMLKRCKKAKSTLNLERAHYTQDEIKELEISVSKSLEISSGLAKGVSSGALTAFGAYGSVGMLASASTGTAISTLSGAAATNATLAWLGGGSLAAGGFGMAGGMAVLGGIALGPAVAITGLMMNSKAEKNLTKAYEYEAEIDLKIEKINSAIIEMELIEDDTRELISIIEGILNRFDNTLVEINDVKVGEKVKRFFIPKRICDLREFLKLLELGKTLKDLLNVSLVERNGGRNKNLKSEIERITIR
jgi:hypothetical protein